MGTARPARTDHGHEAIREITYRERGRALAELRDAARHALAFWDHPTSADARAHLAEALDRWADTNDTDAE